MSIYNWIYIYIWLGISAHPVSYNPSLLDCHPDTNFGMVQYTLNQVVWDRVVNVAYLTDICWRVASSNHILVFHINKKYYTHIYNFLKKKLLSLVEMC